MSAELIVYERDPGREWTVSRRDRGTLLGTVFRSKDGIFVTYAGRSRGYSDAYFNSLEAALRWFRIA